MLSSKKIMLVIAAFLGLATQFNVSAYNVTDLKTEVMLIEHYAQHCTTTELRDWLENTIDSTYLTSNYLIVSIASTISDKHLSVIQKNDQLFCLMHDDKKKWHFYHVMANGAFVSMYIGAICYILYNDALRWLANHDASLLDQARYDAQQVLNAAINKQAINANKQVNKK